MASKPHPFDFSRRTKFPREQVDGTASPSQFAKNLADKCKSQVEQDVDVTFRQYTVYNATSSTPTPNSGSTTGIDYFIDVIVDTEVRTPHFSGLARYLQLTVYVDQYGSPSLKETNFHK